MPLTRHTDCLLITSLLGFPNSCPTLGFRVIFRHWLVALKPSPSSLSWPPIEFSSNSHWFLKEECAIRIRRPHPHPLPFEPPVPANPGSAPTLPHACLQQPHPLEGHPVWPLGLLTADKGCREALSRGFLRLEHGSECISWCHDGTGSHTATARG